ncbi:MAG: hypothetical protein SPF70_06130 [Lachnospiraceae bacterium]|nr:hypothetical protein [Lachnospiraceae bacterium]
MSENKNVLSFWKSTGADIKFLMLILVGFMLLIFDQHVTCSWLNGIYPAFQQSYNINEEFQLYTLNYVFGMKANIYEYSIGEISYHLKVDIFPDLIGYIFITIGLLKLSGKTKIFNISAMTSMFSIILYVVIRLLPFIFNGEQLSYLCFWLVIAQFGLDICIGYMFVYGICDLLQGYQYVRDRKAIGISWFVTVIVNAAVLLLSWLSAVINPALLTFYNMFDLAVNLLFFYFVFRIRDYIFGYRKA